jgi:hypothetical protein
MTFLYATIVYATFSIATSQTQRLIINSFNNGPSTANRNALGFDQGATGAKYSVSNNRLHMYTEPNTPARFWTSLSSPTEGCLSIPPVLNIETLLSFRLQAPPGLDMGITMQTGSNGCAGAVNNSAVVRLSSYSALDGSVTRVRVPLTDFEPTGFLNGRLRAIVIEIPSLQQIAHIQLDECQIISRPRVLPLNTGSGYGRLMMAGPPSGQWTSARADSRCGPSFGWAGCDQNNCCSARGWCGKTPMHCLSVRGLINMNY